MTRSLGVMAQKREKWKRMPKTPVGVGVGGGGG